MIINLLIDSFILIYMSFHILVVLYLSELIGFQSDDVWKRVVPFRVITALQSGKNRRKKGGKPIKQTWLRNSEDLKDVMKILHLATQES